MLSSNVEQKLYNGQIKSAFATRLAVVPGAGYKSTVWHVHCLLWTLESGMHSVRKETTTTSILVESIGDNEFINQIGISPMERAINVWYVDFVQRSATNKSISKIWSTGHRSSARYRSLSGAIHRHLRRTIIGRQTCKSHAETFNWRNLLPTIFATMTTLALW